MSTRLRQQHLRLHLHQVTLILSIRLETRCHTIKKLRAAPILQLQTLNILQPKLRCMGKGSAGGLGSKGTKCEAELPACLIRVTKRSEHKIVCTCRSTRMRLLPDAHLGSCLSCSQPSLPPSQVPGCALPTAQRPASRALQRRRRPSSGKRTKIHGDRGIW